MSHVLGKFFIILFCAFCLLGNTTLYAQVYDGPVGNNSIPNSYEGFSQGGNPNAGGGPGVDGPPGGGCEFQDPLNPLCPIDDYVYVLLFLGVGYGFIKFRRHRVVKA